MKTTQIRITLTEEMLGTACGNPEVHKEFIASKSADAAKAAEEIAALPAAELENRQKTVFHRDADGRPMLFDYQLKGFIKEAVGILCEVMDGEVKVGKSKISKYTFKRLVDNYVFIKPRKIRLSATTVGPDCVRPLRAETMKGERVSLATSETVPAGTTLEFSISTLGGNADFDKLLEACLDYGGLKGLGCWRNSGKGRFEWEKLNGEGGGSKNPPLDVKAYEAGRAAQKAGELACTNPYFENTNERWCWARGWSDGAAAPQPNDH